MLVAFMLMSTLGASGFGAFSLAIATQLFVLGIVDAGVLTPLIVKSNGSEETSPFVYLQKRLASVLTLSSVLSFAAFLLALGFYALFLQSDKVVEMSAAISIGALSLCFREALRTTLLTGNKFAAIVLSEAGTSLALLGTIAYFSYGLGATISAAQALLTVAFFHGLTALLGLFVVRPHIAGYFSLQSLHSVWREGVRSLVAAKISWVQSQSYLYVVGWLISSAAAGYLAASRMVFAPLQTAFSGIARGLLPDMAAYAARRDWSSFRTSLRKWYVGFGLLAITWAVVGTIVFPWIFQLFEAGDLVPSKESMAAWGSVFFFTVLRSTGALGLKAASRFDLLIRQGIIGALTSVAAVPTGVIFYGPIGALWGLALAETVAFFYSAWSIRSLCLTTK